VLKRIDDLDEAARQIAMSAGSRTTATRRRAHDPRQARDNGGKKATSSADERWLAARPPRREPHPPRRAATPRRTASAAARRTSGPSELALPIEPAPRWSRARPPIRRAGGSMRWAEARRASGPPPGARMARLMNRRPSLRQENGSWAEVVPVTPSSSSGYAAINLQVRQHARSKRALHAFSKLA